MTLESLLKSTRNIAVLDEAIEVYRALLEKGASHEDHGNSLVSGYCHLGSMLRARFLQTRELEDIDQAIAAHQRAVDIHDGDELHMLRIAYYNVAEDLHQRFLCSGEVQDINNALASLDFLLGITPSDHEMLVEWLMLRVQMLDAHAMKSNDAGTLQDAISTLRRVISLTPEGETMAVAGRVFLLGQLYRRLFEQTQTQALYDIGEAIALMRRGIDILPEGHPATSSSLVQLAQTLHMRADFVKDIADIDAALETQKRALSLTTLQTNLPALPSRLAILSILHNARYQYSKDPSDIDESVAYERKAIENTPEHEPDAIARRSASLANWLQTRFLDTGMVDLDDIDESIRLTSKAVEISFERDSEYFQILHRHIVGLEIRFEHGGSLPDIHEAISVGRTLHSILPVDYPKRPRYLLTLGNCLLLRFKHTGEMDDIHEAIALYQETLLGLVDGSPIEQALCFNNIGISLQCRFMRTGLLSDIDEAVSALVSAVDLIPDGHPDIPARLNNLATSFYIRHGITKNLDDLDEGISSIRKSVRLTPGSHHSLPIRLATLSALLQVQFKSNQDIAKMDEAISCLTQALDTIPESHAHYSSILHNVALCYILRFETTKHQADFDFALAYFEQAIDSTPVESPQLTTIHHRLAEALMSLHKTTSETEHQSQAIVHYRLAATSSAGIPSARLSSACQWARLSSISGNLEESFEGFDVAITLLSSVAGLDQTLERRHASLVHVPKNLISHAAAIAFSVHRFDKAIEWLEQGRCLVWNQLRHLRAPLDALRAHDPELAERILEVARDLERTALRGRWNGSSIVLDTSDETLEHIMRLQDDSMDAARHSQLAKRWDELLIQVRSTIGFETFLKPASYLDLVGDLPKGGYVVVVNTHRDRCDGLILASGQAEPLHVPLPLFTYRRAEELHKNLKDMLTSKGLRSVDINRGDDEEDETRGLRAKRQPALDKSMSGLLNDLWIGVAQPVLEALNLKNTAFPSTRIWWCTTGPLTFLPLHAAGVYGHPETSISVADYVVSSCIPSVSALVDRIRKERTPRTEHAGLLLISQPNAEGLASIPGTIRETQSISHTVTRQGLKSFILDNKAATIRDTVEQLRDYSCIHMACHAVQDANTPLESGFFLSDGRLTLSKLIESRLEEAELAFLSACQTSTGHDQLSEEAVHLAAGMLAAGYRGVIATMWAISDAFAPKVAEDFYRHLLDRKGRELGGEADSQAAFALHQALAEVRASRNTSDGSFLTWVPYVHFGI